MTSKTIIPKILNLAEIRQSEREPVLVHLTKEQWEHVLAGVKEADAPKPDVPALEIAPMPGGHGAVLLALALCPLGTSQVIIDIERPDATGKGTSVTFMCYGDKPTGEPNPPLPQHCHLALRFESEHNAKFVCIDSQGKICSDYRIVWAHSKSGTRFLFCQPIHL